MAKRRANGEGTIFQRKDGRWVARVEIAGRPRFFYGRYQKDVKKCLDAALEAARKGIYAQPTNLTFEDWNATWLTDYAAPRIAASTLDSYEKYLTNHINPALGDYTLAELSADPGIIQSFYAELLKTAPLNGRGKLLSKRTAEHIHVIIHSSLRQAVRSGKIYRNPDDMTDPPRPEKRESPYMPVEMFNRFLHDTLHDRWFTAYLVAFGTGLRLGEMVALKWDKYDSKTGCLTIDESATRVRNRNKEHNTRAAKTVIITKSPKSRKGKRIVPLPAEINSLLEQWRQRQDEEKAIVEEGYMDQGYIFTWEDGRPVESGTLSKHFKKLIRDGGYPENLTFHKLRHSYATALLEHGENIKVVQELLGHSSVATTGDIYSHVVMKTKTKAASKIGSLLTLEDVPEDVLKKCLRKCPEYLPLKSLTLI